MIEVPVFAQSSLPVTVVIRPREPVEQEPTLEQCLWRNFDRPVGKTPCNLLPGCTLETVKGVLGREVTDGICQKKRIEKVGKCTVDLCKGPGSNNTHCRDEWRLISAGECPFTKE